MLSITQVLEDIGKSIAAIPIGIAEFCKNVSILKQILLFIMTVSATYAFNSSSFLSISDYTVDLDLDTWLEL